MEPPTATRSLGLALVRDDSAAPRISPGAAGAKAALRSPVWANGTPLTRASAWAALTAFRVRGARRHQRAYQHGDRL